MTSIETVPVLIVGAGPAGLTLAGGLARQGVGSLVIERHAGTSTFPKASGISTRSMEILRSWGLESAIRAHSLRALPLMSGGATLTATERFAAPLGFPTDEQALAVSPTRPAISPQDHVEPVLLRHARRYPCVDVRFATELTSIEQDGDGVTVVVRDLQSGTDRTVRAAYLVGADGTRSTVRGLLGIETHGPDDLGAYATILFRADLWAALPEPRYGLYQLTGEIPGVFVPTGPDDRWVFGMPLLPGSPDVASAPAGQWVGLIRAAAGLPDLDVEVLSAMPVGFLAQAADRVRDGRAFLIGDAAHRMPPMGGRGMNSAIADAYSLAWRLAWVVRGIADPALLDTYAAEREPVGRHNLELAASQGRAGTPDGLTEDLGYVYRSAAIDSDEDGDEPAASYRFPTAAVPGARLPHVWLEGRSETMSTLDLVSDGLTLLTGAGGDAWLAAVEVVRSSVAVPLAGYAIGTDLIDRDRTFAERFGLGPDGAVLVRPDGHIAWRRDAGASSDHGAELRAAIGLALGRRARQPGRVPV